MRAGVSHKAQLSETNSKGNVKSQFKSGPAQPLEWQYILLLFVIMVLIALLLGGQ